MKTVLCTLMEKYGSDKSTAHQYTWHYDILFRDMRDKNIKLFECGIATGASLRGWRDYFIHGEIIGGDNCEEHLFEEDRIKTILFDQNKDILDTTYDIIIDDACHVLKSQAAFFENNYHTLNIGGYFIIEDINAYELAHWTQIVYLWTKYIKNFYFSIVMQPTTHKDNNNSLIVARRIY